MKMYVRPHTEDCSSSVLSRFTRFSGIWWGDVETMHRQHVFKMSYLLFFSIRELQIKPLPVT